MHHVEDNVILHEKARSFEEDVSTNYKFQNVLFRLGCVSLNYDLAEITVILFR